MRGRKPTPLQFLRARGSHHAKAGDSDLEAPGFAEIPEPPKTLGDVGRAKWFQLCGLLQDMGILTQADMDHVHAYCAWYSRWIESEEKLADEGVVVEHRSKCKGVSPWLRVNQAALERMDKSGAELGLSPTARARLRIRPGGANSAKAHYFDADRSVQA